ncbi:unnamed protein product [Rotaria magnacalcarata]|uniref:Transposase n=1 Tax=Rotaria magnacalcarata TaxID=392030 RepID=A0A816L4N2_9BILA|nr:unnamed protein product [Rotaria magnacalcarata]CAF4953711.1 unnamed protein product [Rotaria magnacalcarata]
MFDIDGVYNSQNDRIWAVDRSEADIKGGTRQKRKFPQKIMVWLGVCSKGVSPLVIFENGTVDHDQYIKEVLPIALKFGNDMFGNDWTFQQDGARPHPMQNRKNGVLSTFRRSLTRTIGLQIVQA